MNHPNPHSFDALISQGMAASQADDGAQAIACFQRACAEQPFAGLPQFLLGAEFAAIGDVAQAETALAHATRLAPDFPMARYQLGLLQFSSGRAALALLTWQPLLALPDADPLPHLVRGFDTLAQDRFDEALDHFGRGQARNTANAALSGDIDKVVAAIRALQADGSTGTVAGAGDSTHATASSATSDTSGEDAGHHVLLTRYRHQGPAH